MRDDQIDLLTAAMMAVLDEMAGTWWANDPVHLRCAAQVARSVLIGVRDTLDADQYAPTRRLIDEALRPRIG